MTEAKDWRQTVIDDLDEIQREKKDIKEKELRIQKKEKKYSQVSFRLDNRRADKIEYVKNCNCKRNKTSSRNGNGYWHTYDDILVNRVMGIK